MTDEILASDPLPEDTVEVTEESKLDAVLKQIEALNAAHEQARLENEKIKNELKNVQEININLSRALNKSGSTASKKKFFDDDEDEEVVPEPKRPARRAPEVEEEVNELDKPVTYKDLLLKDEIDFERQNKKEIEAICKSDPYYAQTYQDLRKFDIVKANASMRSRVERYKENAKAKQPKEPPSSSVAQNSFQGQPVEANGLPRIDGNTPVDVRMKLYPEILKKLQYNGF